MSEQKGNNNNNNDNIPDTSSLNYKIRWLDFLRSIDRHIMGAPSSDNVRILKNGNYDKLYKLLQQDMANSYQLIHGSILTLINDFIKIKVNII